MADNIAPINAEPDQGPEYTLADLAELRDNWGASGMDRLAVTTFIGWVAGLELAVHDDHKEMRDREERDE